MNPVHTIQLLFWVVALVGFVILEAATIGLVSIWFMVGSLCALVVALLHGSFWTQIYTFLGASALSLILLRPLVRKYITPKIVPTNAGSLLGKTAIVTEEINNLEARGCVKISGVLWSARSESGEIIPATSVVTIRKIEGTKMIVSPITVKVKA